MNSEIKNRCCGRLLVGALALAISAQALADCRGSENSAVPEVTPTAEFFDFGNGTVLHRPTRLVWLRCAVGQSWTGTECSGTAAGLDWAAALNAADQAADGGHSDWRVPNRNELGSIVESRCHGPSINGTVFPDSPIGGFWTSSPVSGQDQQAWAIDFDHGTLQPRANDTDQALRLVRGGRM
ncbi:MAG: DUF1566 domain-containing protein [Wenzhouxiangella sp.]|jgi:hypothetical protein|nr:DUF1566 domain-containing protein [Wenzhouxiangella sp.]